MIKKQKFFQARKTQRYSRRELANEIGISEREVSYIETGYHLPSLVTALKFEKFFGIPVEELFEIEV